MAVAQVLFCAVCPKVQIESATGLRVMMAATLACAVALLFARIERGLESSVDSPARGADLAAQLKRIDARTYSEDESKRVRLAEMLQRDVRRRRDRANERESQAWKSLISAADWERFRDARITLLRESLGQFPPVPDDLHVRVTRTLEGKGHRIENVVFESRLGVFVTANLYCPEMPSQSMPGIVICHSHHNPKSQAELQYMGVLWARLGCTVLVMDQLGHGERRQHPFKSAADYAGSYQPSRQDYYFRYNAGMQLHLIGDSLIGWMAWDLMRGVDLLLARPGVDAKRIILLGAVAGGGDAAAVAAAIDRRIAAVVPFNFGGPQPETTYPLPDDAERTFNYAGGGSWESTRNLRLSARDGFLPWLIVGAAAPRRLIYAHEFAWDGDHDPVWRRLETIFDWYGARHHLAEVHGRGSVRGQPPESTHCNNIGAIHRAGIYPALERWFDIAAPVAEPDVRRNADELMCLTPELARDLRPRPLHAIAADIADQRSLAARERLTALPLADRRRKLQYEWARLLGNVEPACEPHVLTSRTEQVADASARSDRARISIERTALEVEPEIIVPLVLLVPPRKDGGRLPVVVAFAQQGKQAFLDHRADELARLVNSGTIVCLPDLRGTGETRPDDDSRGRRSSSTAISSSELMLGQTLIGSRVRDLRSVLRHLRGRAEVDPDRISLWGDSFAAANPPDRRLDVPLDAERLPDHAEPLGGLVALFTALFDDHIAAVEVQGGLTGFASLLDSAFCYVPHDCIVPGALTAGDLCDVAAALAPRPLRLRGLVSGFNCTVSAETLEATFAPVRAAYRSANSEGQLELHAR